MTAPGEDGAQIQSDGNPRLTELLTGLPEATIAHVCAAILREISADAQTNMARLDPARYHLERRLRARRLAAMDRYTEPDARPTFGRVA